MASGNTLCVRYPIQISGPGSSYAEYDRRNERDVLDFDASSVESAYFEGVMPRHYASGGVTCRIAWAASSATTGDVVWGISFERLQDDTDDMDSDSFAAERTVTDTCASVSGELSYCEIAFTDGAQIDSIASGENFRIKLRRLASDGADTMAGDAEMKSIEIRET